MWAPTSMKSASKASMATALKAMSALKAVTALKALAALKAMTKMSVSAVATANDYDGAAVKSPSERAVKWAARDV